MIWNMPRPDAMTSIRQAICHREAWVVPALDFARKALFHPKNAQFYEHQKRHASPLNTVRKQLLY